MQKYNNRSEVPDKYKWDLTDLFKNNDEFLKTGEMIKKEIPKLNEYKGTLKTKLYEYLELDTKIIGTIMDMEVYSMTLSDSDLSESYPLELVGIVQNLLVDYNLATSFFEPEINALTTDEYASLFKDERLRQYKAYLDDIYRNKEHVLNEAEENIVTYLSEPASNLEKSTQTLLNSCNDYGYVTLPSGEKTKLTQTNYNKVMQDLPRETRKKVYKQFNKVRSQYASICAYNLNSYVKYQNNIALIHKFTSSWDKYLFNSKLTDDVFNNLCEVARNSRDVISKYYKLKAKVLGVKKIMPWDKPLDLYKINKEYSIEDAQNMVLDAVKVLGDDYCDHMKLVFEGRHVDYCCYPNKCSGGYNVSSIKAPNSKILMSFNYDLSSVSTLAHETGHHVNHQYMHKENIPFYRNTTSEVAEVCSLTNECLLSNYLVNNGAKEEALAGLANIIETFISNFYGAIYEADMEREFYKYSLNGGSLTKEYLSNLFEEKYKEYISDEVDELQKCIWVSRSHYYMNYYLFSYAISISVATNVASEIIAGNQDMLEGYQKYLKRGCDLSIMEAYQILGIDITKKEVFENAINYFNSLLTLFEKLYKEV